MDKQELIRKFIECTENPHNEYWLSTVKPEHEIVLFRHEDNRFFLFDRKNNNLISCKSHPPFKKKPLFTAVSYRVTPAEHSKIQLHIENGFGYIHKKMCAIVAFKKACDTISGRVQRSHAKMYQYQTCLWIIKDEWVKQMAIKKSTTGFFIQTWYSVKETKDRVSPETIAISEEEYESLKRYYLNV